MSKKHQLVEEYGLLMKMEDMAELLGRSKDGLRISLSTESELAGIFRPTMIKVGRRIYFKTTEVAAALNLTQDEN